jgi:hypothetical protein
MPASAMTEDFNRVGDAAPPFDGKINFRTPGIYSINGRHMLVCSTVGICARGLELCVMVKPQIGDNIDAIFDIIGRLEGQVRELTRVGAIIELDAEIHSGLREQFAFLAYPNIDDAQRRHFRVKPRNPETRLSVANRKSYPARVIDLSISGACIETDAPVTVGEMIDFERFTRAKIIRAFGNRRFGVEFLRHFRPQEFNWNIRL